jgi:hypothetical protein
MDTDAERSSTNAEVMRRQHEILRQAQESARVVAEEARVVAEERRLAAAREVRGTIATLTVLVERMEAVEKIRRTFHNAAAQRESPS